MTFTEIINTIERRTTTGSATPSSFPIAAKTLEVNNALNQYFIIANEGAGNWRPVDDTNHTDYPVVYADIISGQQDYSFTVDEDGNQILGIDKVRILNPDGINWTTLTQVDKDSIDDSYLDTVQTGIPTEYYLTANGIFLVSKPNYNMRDVQEGQAGIEINVARTSTYFTVSDTTKKPGIPWVHAEYLALRPSYFYCLDKGLDQAVSLRELLYGKDGKSGMEGAIKKFYRDRNRSFSTVITSEPVNSI